MLNEKEIKVHGDTIRIRGLTFSEFTEICLMNATSEEGFSSRYRTVYLVGRYGIVGMDSLYDPSTQQLVDYDPKEHYDSLFEHNFEQISMCVDEIMKMTIVSEEERQLIRDQCYFHEYLSDKPPNASNLWNCRECCNNRLIAKRKCTRFDEEEIEKILKVANYIPYVLLNEEERENYFEVTEDDIIEVKAEEPSSRRKRTRLSDVVKKNREIAARQDAERANIEYKPDEFTLRWSDMKYDFVNCPAHIPNPEHQIYLHTSFKCISNETLMIAGAMDVQPNRFIEYTGYIKMYNNEIHEKRMDKRKRVAEEQRKTPAKKQKLGASRDPK